MKSLVLFMLLWGSFTVDSPEPISLSETTCEISTDYVDFTLRNTSLKSIPLIIPGVMNPNLSPMSNSGVGLKIGQKILFKYKGKRRVLLIVDKTLEGKVLDVPKLLKEKRRELEKKK